MTNLVQVVAVFVSTGLLVLIIELVRRRMLVEEYSFIWIVIAAALLLLSLFRGILHTLARWLGIFYPPSLLLLAMLLFVFVGLLYFSVVVSRLRAHLHRLFEESALLDARVRELEAERRAGDQGASSP